MRWVTIKPKEPKSAWIFKKVQRITIFLRLPHWRQKIQYFSLPCAEKRNEYFALLDWFVVACKWYLQRTPQDPTSVKETLWRSWMGTVRHSKLKLNTVENRNQLHSFPQETNSVWSSFLTNLRQLKDSVHLTRLSTDPPILEVAKGREVILFSIKGQAIIAKILGLLKFTSNFGTSRSCRLRVREHFNMLRTICKVLLYFNTHISKEVVY